MQLIHFKISFSLIKMIKNMLVIFKFNIDSGLSLTKSREATEAESDESKLQRQTSLINKQFRPLLVKRNDEVTDSDDVFTEV